MSYYTGKGSCNPATGEYREAFLDVEPHYGVHGIGLAIHERREKRSADLSISLSPEKAEILIRDLTEYLKQVNQHKQEEDARHA